MDYKGISPSELADSIGVQRSNVTHVLKGRNKPSFQFIEKMLQIYPELNAKWLLLGTGNMVDVPQKPQTLFDQVAIPVAAPIPSTSTPIAEEKQFVPPAPVVHQELTETKENITIPVQEKDGSAKDIKDQFFNEEKPIERLIVFFSDQTFKVYNPSR
jgi:transcriptional regulator with XRE-family HTH domain